MILIKTLRSTFFVVEILQVQRVILVFVPPSPLGEKGTGKSTQKPLHYKSCLFHRVVKDFMIQGGDFSEGRM